MLLSRDCSAVGLPREAIKGAVLVSGVYDLEPIRLSYVNEPLHLSEAEVEAWSPIRLEPVTDHPIVLVWGENETQEFKRQSRDYGGWLERHGRRVSRQELGGRNHFDMLLAARENPSWLVASAKSLIDS
jgi:arylformamidase